MSDDVRRAVSNEIGPEDVIGPTGQPEWAVTVSLNRGFGRKAADSFVVRARSYDGAILLAKEVRLGVLDAEAVEKGGE